VSSELLRQAITFQLNQTSGVPACLQIVQQVEQALRMGTLRPGDQLRALGCASARVRWSGASKASLVWRPARSLTGYGGLHLEMQSRYNAGMSTSTVGFAVADEDQERLARLVEHFGGGNRSAYLRATLPVMESLARAERLRELQARNAERAAAAGQDYESLLAEIRQAYKGETRER
jgi:hypothetical protein